jgi:spore maturation protein A
MEVMNRTGVTKALARCLGPILSRLFPSCRKNRELADALSCNVSANLLGLGNAATPSGIRAARLLHRPGTDSASNELCRLVVLNTASVQLLPTTVAAVRLACGCETPFDILPAVWLASVCSVSVGLLAERGLRRWF